MRETCKNNIGIHRSYNEVLFIALITSCSVTLSKHRFHLSGYPICQTTISTVQYSTVQYSTVQCSAVQYSTVQCSTVQYRPVFHLSSSYFYSCPLFPPLQIVIIRPQRIPRVHWYSIEYRLLLQSLSSGISPRH